MPSNKFSQVFLLVVLAWRLIAIPFEIIAYPLRPKLLKFKALRYSVSSFNISLFHSVDFYPFLQPLISSLQHLMTNSSCTACTAAALSSCKLAKTFALMFIFHSTHCLQGNQFGFILRNEGFFCFTFLNFSNICEEGYTTVCNISSWIDFTVFWICLQFLNLVQFNSKPVLAE